MKETYFLTIQLPNGKTVFDSFEAENESSAIFQAEKRNPKGSIILNNSVDLNV